MEHHVASSATGFSNSYAQARVALYGISGIPNSFFDGITNVLGGSTGTYNSFLQKYNQRIAVPSDFTVAINGMNEGLDFTVVISIENMNNNPGTNLVAHLAMTESGVMYGSTPFDYVTRRFWPSVSGTPLNFSSGPNQSVELQFTMESGWDLDKCEFIAFIQSTSTKEILQAAKVPVLDMMPLFFNNAVCTQVNMVPVTNCTGTVEPVVTIGNNGAESLSTVEINYRVNDETVNVFNWSGDLGYGETEMVTLPSVSFDIQDENDLLVYTTNPNGNPDEDPENDTTATSFTSASEAIPNIYLFLKLDGNPEEISWELKDSGGNVLYTGGNYIQAQQLVKDTFELTQEDCYTFAIYDEGGDGLTGGGFFALRQNNMSLFYENTSFEGTEELVQFSTMIVSVEEQAEANTFSVFPNPFEDRTHISFSLENPADVEITIYNVIGEVVYSLQKDLYPSGDHVKTFDADGLNSGIYFVQARIGEKVMTKKISLR
jgi:hypothetical protein